MLPTAKEVEGVLLGEAGALAHLPAGAIVVNSSTISVRATQDLAKATQQAGHFFVDAPVSGGVMAAQSGGLTFMVGGDHSALSQIEHLFQTMGKKIIPVGEAGMGQAAKLCNNRLLAASMIAVSEAFCLADELGLKREDLFEVCAHSSGSCWSLTQYCPAPGLVSSSPANRDYQPGFSVALMLKDLTLAQECAEAVQVNTPLSEHAFALYQQLWGEGHANKDFSYVLPWLKAHKGTRS